MSSMTRVDGYFASWDEVREDRKLQRELDEKRKLEHAKKSKNHKRKTKQKSLHV